MKLFTVTKRKDLLKKYDASGEATALKAFVTGYGEDRYFVRPLKDNKPIADPIRITKEEYLKIKTTFRQ